MCYIVDKGDDFMKEFNFKKCPVCNGELSAIRLICNDCKSEYSVSKPFSKYDFLSDEQKEFLECFLKNKGNIKTVGEELNISYPTVKRKLNNLLDALNLNTSKEDEPMKFDKNKFGNINYKSNVPSEIIRRKLYENNGVVTISLLDGKPCTIFASSDGKTFVSDKLTQKTFPFSYSVFDVIVDLLLKSNNYSAPKGNGHGKEDKVGYGKCTDDTVMGAIAINYFKKSYGESTYDPVFVLAAMLDWAGIASNNRGYISLTADYLSKCYL